MHERLRGVAVGVAAVGLLAACEDVGSKNIKTDGMFADFEVTARADGDSEVRAALRVGGGLSNTYVELSPGDVLSATSGSETHTLTEDGSGAFNVHVYHATFSGIEEDKAFTIGFDRADDVSAPDSHTTLPAPFQLTAPTANQEVSRADALTISWTPANTRDDMSARLDGDCIIVAAPHIDSDSGTLTLPADSLSPSAGHEGDTCNVDIRIARTRSGGVDPAFGEGGHFNAVQLRTITIRSTP